MHNAAVTGGRASPRLPGARALQAGAVAWFALIGLSQPSFGLSELPDKTCFPQSALSIVFLQPSPGEAA